MGAGSSITFERRSFALLIAGACAAGCTSWVSTSKYASNVDAPEGSALHLLEAGKRIVVHAPKGSCSVTYASTFNELKNGGTAVAGDARFASGQAMTIESSKVHTTQNWIALEVTSAGGETEWLRVLGGSPLGCIHPAPKASSLITNLPWSSDTAVPATFVPKLSGSRYTVILAPRAAARPFFAPDYGGRSISFRVARS